MIDVDNKPASPSKYISATERNRISYFFKNEYGLNVVWYRSSDSLGWHGYIFLQRKVLTFDLACFLHLALTKANFDVSGGTLEIYPNIKSDKYALYKGLRCPCAEGFGATVSQFVRDARQYSCDVKDEALEEARQESNSIRFNKRANRPNPNKFSGLKLKIYNEYRDVIETGWTDVGQTAKIMYLLITKGKRLGLFKSRDDCFNNLIKQLPLLPGHGTFCNHIEDLDIRLENQLERIWHTVSELEFKEYVHVSYAENKKRQLANKNDDVALSIFCNEEMYKKNGTPNFSKMSKECGIKRETLKVKWNTVSSIVKIAPLLYTEKHNGNTTHIYINLFGLYIMKMHPILYYTFTLRSKCIEEDGAQNEKDKKQTYSDVLRQSKTKVKGQSVASKEVISIVDTAVLTSRESSDLPLLETSPQTHKTASKTDENEKEVSEEVKEEKPLKTNLNNKLYVEILPGLFIASKDGSLLTEEQIDLAKQVGELNSTLLEESYLVKYDETYIPF